MLLVRFTEKIATVLEAKVKPWDAYFIQLKAIPINKFIGLCSLFNIVLHF